MREIEFNNHVARLYIKSDEFDKAEEHLKTSLRLQEELYGKTSYHQNCTVTYIFLALVAIVKCERDVARRYLTIVLNMTRYVKGKQFCQL